jgi:hypothetical protein
MTSAGLIRAVFSARREFDNPLGLVQSGGGAICRHRTFEMPTKCSVFHCNHPSVAKDLCATHYKRLKRHGDLEQTRPNDWGAREKHPAYKAWCGLRRYHHNDMPPHWRDDFWSFVKEVPAKPDGEAKAFRPNKQSPWASDNFYWREPVLDRKMREYKREYQRVWSQRARQTNKSYFKNADLKRTYGIDLSWYEAQHAKQDGKCAICCEPETAHIRGKTLSLAVDHCHDTGEIRGLLCRACNNAIGALKHDQKLLRKAIDYLGQPTTKPLGNDA